MKTDEKILELLKVEGKLSLKQIAEKLNVNQSTISMAAKKLESESKIILNRMRIEKSFVNFASLTSSSNLETASPVTLEPPAADPLQEQRPRGSIESEAQEKPAENEEKELPSEATPILLPETYGKYTPDELRIIVMNQLRLHKKKHFKKLVHLPKSWGGSLTAGGGWSGPWLQLLELLAEAL